MYSGCGYLLIHYKMEDGILLLKNSLRINLNVGKLNNWVVYKICMSLKIN